MTENNIQMPVAVLNYSSLTQLLRNPLMFKMAQILGVFSSKKGMSSMIGSAGHEALKVYYGGNKDIATPADPAEAWELAISCGEEFLNTYPDAGIRYGKKGTREKMVQGFAQAMKIYREEEPDYGDSILICEEKLTSALKDSDGNEFPLPASGVPDLVIDNGDGTVDVIDNKFVSAFTPKEDEDGEPYEDYIKIVQAMFLVYLLKGAKNLTVRRVIFREIKRTLNVDPKTRKPTGAPQIVDYVVPGDHEPYHIFFKNLYRDVVEFLKNPNAIYLPNLSDQFDGQEAGLMYAQGLISGDMSDVEVMHRVKEVAYTSKKFVPSILDRAENDNLLPEERVKVKLREFGVFVTPQETVTGDNVTQYRFKLSAGTSMGRIKKHKDDIVQALRVKGEIRILTPIPGTDMLGIEVENVVRTSSVLTAKDLVMGTLTLPIGTDVNGIVTKEPLDKMPHIMVAGTTGSGKSTVVHNFLEALTKQMSPEEMHLTLIDPKRVELTAFARKPHVQGKVLFAYEDALRALLRAVAEMDRRYLVLEKAEKRDLAEYNASRRSAANRLPYEVIVIDEFADFMLRAAMERKKKKDPAYGSKSKRWLYKQLTARAGKSGELFIVDEENGDENNLRKIKIGPARDYQKDDIIDILEADDAGDPLKGPEADIELLMVRIAQLGRAAGIHLIVATQRPSVDVITGLIKANFPVRIALTTASMTDSTVILGKPGAEKLSGKGDMLFMHPALKGEVRLQGFAMKKK